MSRRLGSTNLKGLPSPSAGKYWPATAWELVRKARDAGGREREEARRQLLTLYYKPVHRFFARVLRVGASRLEDVTQEFFTRFIEKDFLKNLRHEKCFSNFLKVACRRHYINWCEAERVRQGGSSPKVSLDEFGSSVDRPLEEGHFSSLLDEELRASFLEEAMQRVKESLTAGGKEEAWKIFEARTRVDGGAPPDYATLSKQFGIKVFDIRNRIAAARKIFREALLQIARERSDDGQRELEELGLMAFLQ